MASKVFTQRNFVILILLLFFGSIIGGALESGLSRRAAKIPDSSIIHGTLNQAQKYAILSRGFILMVLYVPSDCDFFCQKEVAGIENIIRKYSPYVFLEEKSEGVHMSAVLSTSYGERTIEDVNATSAEDAICDIIPIHPECRRIRAIRAIQEAENYSLSQNASAGLP